MKEVKQYGLKLEKFDKTKKLNVSTKVFLKNFPAYWTEQNLADFITERVELEELKLTDVFIA